MQLADGGDSAGRRWSGAVGTGLAGRLVPPGRHHFRVGQGAVGARADEARRSLTVPVGGRDFLASSLPSEREFRCSRAGISVSSTVGRSECSVGVCTVAADVDRRPDGRDAACCVYVPVVECSATAPPGADVERVSPVLRSAQSALPTLPPVGLPEPHSEVAVRRTAQRALHKSFRTDFVFLRGGRPGARHRSASIATAPCGALLRGGGPRYGGWPSASIPSAAVVAGMGAGTSSHSREANHRPALSHGTVTVVAAAPGGSRRNHTIASGSGNLMDGQRPSGQGPVASHLPTLTGGVAYAVSNYANTEASVANMWSQFEQQLLGTGGSPQDFTDTASGTPAPNYHTTSVNETGV